jgi:tetratricopeptide (TPR) repeat protein
MSSNGLRRLALAAALVLLVCTPIVAIGYLLDQHTDPGPTLADRRSADLEDAVRKQPRDIGLRLSLAATYLAAERSQDALGQYDAIIKVAPDNAVALLGKAGILEDGGDLAGAKPLYQHAVDVRKDGEMAKADADLQQAYYGLGSIAVKQGGFADAIAALESSVRIDSTDADAWYLLGVAQLGDGSPEQAVQAERKAVMFVPTEWSEPYETMAKAYAAQGLTANVAYALAMVDLVAKRYPEARQRLLPLANGPAAADATLGLGLVAEKQGDTADAIGWYRKALALDPHSLSASGGLGRLGIDAPSPSTAPASEAPSGSPASGNG